MAYRQPGQNTHTARPNHGARSASGQLRTQDLSSSSRFSFAETPVQTQSAVFQQFNSPTNSTIEESPVVSFVPNPTQYIAESERRSPYPHEKVPARVESPYNFEPPQEVHPAHFAPYAETSPVSSHQRSDSYQLSSLPPQPHSAVPSQFSGSTYAAASSVPLLKSSDQDYKHEHRQYHPPPRTPTYNPHALTGPNDATENHRPGQVSHPNANLDPEWKHGMCELDALCCLGLFCPCMVYGKTQYRLAQKAQRREATDLLGYESWNGSCGLMAVACGFQWIFTAIERTRVRKLYHLKGSFGDDCIKSLCCCCCVLMQSEREVRGREELIRRHAGPAAAYVSPGTMVYAPPPR